MVPTSANQEMDEYIFDSDDSLFSDDVPVRILNNRALYNADSKTISLELIPMKLGADNEINPSITLHPSKIKCWP
jgi:DNA (cytosine-5)-methyltransferase 1